MKAIVATQYGSPDVLELQEVKKPRPNKNQILIKIYAASANPLDWHIMRGKPLFARLSFGLFKLKYPILGADVSGRVEEVGSEVQEFKPGDEVFGTLSTSGYGGFGEYVLTNSDCLVKKPNFITHEEAAAIPVAGLTAVQSLRYAGHINAIHKVLINGSSGGVGSFTVQLAKALGAEVTGVCSSGNLEVVKLLGADHVIDYTENDFCRSGVIYDLIIDNVGNRTTSDLAIALKPKGKAVIVGFTNMKLMLQHAFKGKILSKQGGKSIGIMPVARMIKADLEYLLELINQGKVKPLIDKQFELKDTPDAIRYLETGRARGKVIIKV